MRKKRITGFAGKVEPLELQHVIQISCLAGITATIFVRQGNQKGYIYVRSGQIVHAVAAGLTGQEAVNEMVFWRVGRFDLKHGISNNIADLDHKRLGGQMRPEFNQECLQPIFFKNSSCVRLLALTTFERCRRVRFV